MNFKPFYPILEKQTYLNTAACGLIAKPVKDFKIKDINDYYGNGSGYMEQENTLVLQTKKMISKVYNAEVERIAITPNFTLAYNTILDALPKTYNFLCLDEDYWSVYLPVKIKGFAYKTIPITINLETDIYEHVAKYKPDAIALSMVQYLSGIKIKQDFFKQLKSDFPDLKILIDATQYLGTEIFDFKNSGIDLLISSGYKWLGAGLGNAITLISDELYAELSPKQIGSNSFYDKANHKQNPMGFLEPGHYDLNTIGTLQVALDFHYNYIGIDIIEKKIKTLSKRALEKLTEIGVIDKNLSQRKTHSSIFMLNIEQDKYEQFKKENIILSKRGKGLRVSLNYFNTFDDLEHLIDHLKS